MAPDPDASESDSALVALLKALELLQQLSDEELRDEAAMVAKSTRAEIADRTRPFRTPVRPETMGEAVD